MLRLLLAALACLLPGLGSPALAEREVHVVAVGKGQETSDVYGLPEARVLVDRPGRRIGLVLLDGGELLWRVEATQGTVVEEIILGGPRPGTSEVFLSGIRVVGAQMADLPLVFRPAGRDFRALIDRLTRAMGTERIHGFQATHQVLDRVLRIDRVDDETAGLARDYLSQRIGRSDDLPQDIRDWIAAGAGPDAYAVDFDAAGFTLTGPAGTRRFPAPPHVPDIELPSAANYDPATQTIFGVSYGGEGFLYSVDARSGEWEVLGSLEGYDAAGLLFVAGGRQLILTGAFSRPGEIKVYRLGGLRFSTFIPTRAFPGLTDLFDFGNEHGPPLIPRAYSEGWLLVDARGKEGSAYPGAGAYRLYAVRLETREVRLLRFRD